MIFSLHHFYVILQVAGIGYITGGIIIVEYDNYRVENGNRNGKLNFWQLSSTALRHTLLGGTNKFILRLDNRRKRHVPAVLLQQNDLPVPLERRQREAYSPTGRFGVDKTPLPVPGFESIFLS